MKFRGAVLFSILTLVLLVAAYLPGGNQTQKESVLMQTIIRGLDQLHYSPQKIDDEFSQKVFNLYLDYIDGGRRFLTQEDVDKLKVYQRSIDEEANAGTYQFFDLSVELINAGMVKTQNYYREILAQPFDFTVEEAVEINGEGRLFAKNDKELKDFWRRYLKYETLTRLSDKIAEQEKLAEGGEKKSFDELEREARESTLKLFDDWFDRLNRQSRNDRLSIYLNTITSTYDPHTNYFKPIDKENFDIRMSGRLEGIGARLQSEGDYTKVVDIVVGGPAWKGKELGENDLILKVTQEGKEPVDIKGMDLNEVVQLIRGPKGTKVELTVKKVDGTVRNIAIVRDVVILDERFAKSLILDGAHEGEKIGYISLPSFYADFENNDGRFCSTDVAAEIEKLKAEGVNGIILDLRNNGGGSLRDVVKMSGFFIEKGPIVQVKSRDKNPEVLMDVDPTVQYDGPLVVMVNSFSASASEILAAALQDYGRAVIVGSNSTFGKGTVQRFVDLDRTIRGFDELKPLGEIKLTTQKFYRINGGSTQLRGVVPDIILPDRYHFIKTGEKEEKYPMEWTEIQPASYSKKVATISNIDKIKARSQARVKKDPVFQKVLESARWTEKFNQSTSYPLDLNGYQAFKQEQEEKATQFDNIFDKTLIGKVANPAVDVPVILADESKKARNEHPLNSVSKDAYIYETLQIIHDLIVDNIASK
jgi:carboxyl-terminal processing protease